MKIGFICSNFYGFFAFQRLLAHPDIEPLFVVGLDERRFRESGMAAYYYQGSRYFAYASGHDIDTYLTSNLNDDPRLIELLKQKGTDFVFAMGWPDILSARAMAIPRHGCVGIHPSWLPRYRGGAPLNWQFLDGCTQIGVSSFFFSDKVDSGNTLVQKLYDVPEGGTVTTFLEDTYIQATWEVFEETAHYLKSGGRGKASDLSEGFYRRRRRPEDGRIAFHDSPKAVIRLIHAQTPPFPPAFFQYEGKTYFVTHAEQVPASGDGPVGEVLEVTPYALVVRCAGGAVRLSGIIRDEPQTASVGQVHTNSVLG